MPSEISLLDRNVLLGAHLGLMAAVIATLVAINLEWTYRLLLMVLLLAPLAACLRGILAGRRKVSPGYHWLWLGTAGLVWLKTSPPDPLRRLPSWHLPWLN